MSCDYVLEKRDTKAKLSVLIHLELNFMKMTMFNLFAKKKLDESLVGTLKKLKSYCEEKVASGNKESTSQDEKSNRSIEVPVS